MKKNQGTFNALLFFLTLGLIALFLSSCGTTHYNVGTGKPMTKHCNGHAWWGGQ